MTITQKSGHKIKLNWNKGRCPNAQMVLLYFYLNFKEIDSYCILKGGFLAKLLARWPGNQRSTFVFNIFSSFLKKRNSYMKFHCLGGWFS